MKHKKSSLVLVKMVKIQNSPQNNFLMVLLRELTYVQLKYDNFR
jgi:hypothetical protein